MMLRSALLLIGLMVYGFQGNSQSLEWGAKVGATHQNFGDIFGDWNTFTDRFNSDFGGEIGFYGRGKFLGIFIQPELMFHHTNKNIKVDGDRYKISYSRLNFPVLIGQRYLKVFRWNVGPVGTLHLGGNSGDIEQLSYNTFNIGGQFGVGADIWKLRFDLKYQVSFSELTNKVEVGNQEFEPTTYGNFFLLEVGYKLGG